MHQSSSSNFSANVGRPVWARNDNQENQPRAPVFAAVSDAWCCLNQFCKTSFSAGCCWIYRCWSATKSWRTPSQESPGQTRSRSQTSSGIPETTGFEGKIVYLRYMATSPSYLLIARRQQSSWRTVPFRLWSKRGTSSEGEGGRFSLTFVYRHLSPSPRNKHRTPWEK